MPHLKKLIILVSVIAIGILASELSAQENDGWKRKAKDIKGDGLKVTVETTEGTFIFNGNEAKGLVDNIKSSPKKIKLITKHSNDDFSFEDELESIRTEFLVVDDTSDGLKKIEIELASSEDGEKVVKITTEEDGQETVEVLEGKRAEEYLEKHMKKDSHSLKKTKVVTLGDDLDEEEYTIWITDDFEDEGSLKKEIKIELDSLDESMAKKITIETIKDGKKTVEVLEGKEADEFLKKHQKGKKMMFITEDGDVSSFDGKKVKVRDLGDGDEVEIEFEVDDDVHVDKKVIIKKKK